jgi:hypothetical protein
MKQVGTGHDGRGHAGFPDELSAGFATGRIGLVGVHAWPWIQGVFFAPDEEILRHDSGALEFLCRFRYTMTCFQKRREISEDHAASSNYNRDSEGKISFSDRQVCFSRYWVP